jgi:hypothetical protein
MLTGTPSDTRPICSQLILRHRSLGAFDMFEASRAWNLSEIHLESQFLKHRKHDASRLITQNSCLTQPIKIIPCIFR